MAAEGDILNSIDALVKEEHDLRERHERGEIADTTERQRLAAIEVELDRCWDLLRQRRARSDAGQDPDQAQIRPADEVEGYIG